MALPAHAQAAVDAAPDTTSVYVFDLRQVPRLMAEWKAAFPRIRPFFAVKCNSDDRLVRALHAEGVGYDCASPSEIAMVTALGAPPTDVLYANPIKVESDIRAATAMGITQMSFDSVDELHKIKAHATGPVSLLLRLKCGDDNALLRMGDKFGADASDWPVLLAEARALELPVDGICFHLGSGCMNPTAYSNAIEQAANCIALAATYGFAVSTLNIGGGFASPLNPAVVAAINDTIALKVAPTLRVIAEPGRFFAETVCTLYSRVIGKRVRTHVHDYFIHESIHGSFFFAPFGKLNPVAGDGATFASNVYGDTCHGGDIISKNIQLPEHAVGDWFEFRRMGAYTHVFATTFNGMDFANCLTKVYLE
ncbi:ornithine decarboxylase-like [Achlya hypogyna]|uniref:ornithine decarboxylase n=1 Tax=Achlya hypogyna TaxID=1202772 RepID=A0A1V9Y5Q7_ACHHY|nr:ornithine decarboxylase-like [Achlya hypogyna]